MRRGPGLFSRLASAIKGGVTGSYWTADDTATGSGGIGKYFFPRWSYPPKRTTQDWLNFFHQTPRLDSLDMIAHDCAAAKFQLYNKAEYKNDPMNAEPIADHPFYDFWDNPMPDHPEADGFYLRYLMEIYLDLIGEGFIWVGRKNMKGMPIEAYPIVPSWVLWTPTLSKNVFKVMPLGNVSHQQIDIAPSEMIWLKNPDIAAPFGRGRGRAEAIGDEMEADELASKFQKKLFFNDAVPPIIISLLGASEPELKAFAETWIQKYGGTNNARKPGVVGFDAKVQKLIDNPREMEMTKSREFLRDVCNQHWGIPPELHGILEHSNRSTIDSAYYLYTKNIINKRLGRRAAMYNRQLVPMFGDDIIGAYEEVVPEDEAQTMLIATDGLKLGTVTVDEWRNAAGMDDLPGGAGQVFLRTFNILVVPEKDSGEPPAPVAPEPDNNLTPDAVDSQGQSTAQASAEQKGSPDQPRDDHGLWTSGGGGSENGKEGAKEIRDYSDNGFSTNENLRDGDDSGAEIQIIDNAIQNYGENISDTLYRGASSDMSNYILQNGNMERIEIGENEHEMDFLFVDDGFISTSRDISTAQDFGNRGGGRGAVFEITGPKYGLDVDRFLKEDQTQSEIVLPRGSSIHISSVRIDENDSLYHFKCEVE